jgi:hypothetical protein
VVNAWFNAFMTEAPVVPLSMPTPARREPSGLARIIGYFVVFFASMTLMGILFTMGGISIILLPGSLPIWVDLGYIVVSIAGSVLVSLLLANRIFRVSAPAPADRTAGSERTRPTMLGWIAGISGTVIGGVLSAALSALVLRFMERS